MVGDAAFTVTASGGSGTGAVTYASDNTEVASVINSGEVTIVAVGRTTITATKAADVDYNEATATYVSDRLHDDGHRAPQRANPDARFSDHHRRHPGGRGRAGRICRRRHRAYTGGPVSAVSRP